MSENWPVKPLAEVANFHSGFAFPEVFQGQQEGELPFFKVSDMSREGNERRLCSANNYVSRQLAEKLNWKPAPEGGIAFAKVGAALLLNRRRELGQDSLFDNNVVAVSAKADVSDQWLYWQLLTVDFADFVQVGALPSINQQQLGVLPIPVPATREQKKIAQILDTLDTQIRQTEALIAKLERIKQGLLTDLLTRGIDQNGQLRSTPDQAPQLYKESPLGRIPREWEVTPLGRLSEIVSGVTLGGASPGLSAKLVPYLRVANVQDGYLDLSEIKYIRVTASDAEKYRLQDGDVLMNEGGDYDKLGRGTVWRNEIADCVHQNHVFRVRPDPSVLLSDYLAAYCASPGGKTYFLRSSKQSTNLASINSTQLKAFPIPLAPIHEQHTVNSVLYGMNVRLKSENCSLSKLMTQKMGLMDDLLTGRVRVTPLLETAELAHG
ncbi:restriction endonuclease subunit S [Thiohalomonas denitrificans]|uniref:restriction endonuclease subunit S n=1 Tax=Thiohalomonas denitrificans TaxID=415747 RepID=UPI0026EC6BED|nr:restriction endonuclease subunit S [Thiohalomonas denitrificans]